MIRKSTYFQNIVVTVLICLFFVSCDLFTKKPDLKKAQHAEINGNIPEALALYTETLLMVTDVFTLPDKNRGKFLKPTMWKNEVESYLLWINSSETKTSDAFKKALDGVLNCNNLTPLSNRLVHLKTTILDSNSFAVNWNQSFFTQNVKIDPEHTGMRKTSISKGISFIRISSPKNYSYTIHLLNTIQKKRVVAKLYPESEVTFMATPGEYFFICKSTITFESGQVWISSFSISKLTIPEKSSLITADLLTSVSR